MSIQSDPELDPLGFYFLPQEFCRLVSRRSGNLPGLPLPVRERHRAPDDATGGSSALSPASVAVSPGRHDLQPHEHNDSLADAAVDRRHGGWTKLDGDGPAILRGIRPDHAAGRGRFFPAIHQMQFCTGRRKGSQATKRAIAGPQARPHPIQRINEVEGLNLLWQDLTIENASTVLDPVTECMSCPPKELLESYAAS